MKNRSSNYTSSYGQSSPSVVVGASVIIALVVVGYFFAGAFFRSLNGENIYDHQITDENTASSDQDINGLSYVYFSVSSQKSKNDCGLVYPVVRNIEGENKEVAALTEILKGPTIEERKNGAVSFFSDDTNYVFDGLIIRDDIAGVNFTDIASIIPDADSSCGSLALMASVESTLYQFGNIKKVIFAIDGSPRKFYEWAGIGCNEENNNCDASIFP